MKIRFIPVNSQNRQQVQALTVAPSQAGFIETTAQCMEEADQCPQWRPVGIYDGEQLVGFAMYGLWKQEGEGGRVWLDRFMIDERYQGMGYGRAALPAILEKIRQEYGRNEIFLSLYEENRRAMHLYEQAGFHLTGETDPHGEKLMVTEMDGPCGL